MIKYCCDFCGSDIGVNERNAAGSERLVVSHDTLKHPTVSLSIYDNTRDSWGGGVIHTCTKCRLIYLEKIREVLLHKLENENREKCE